MIPLRYKDSENNVFEKLDDNLDLKKKKYSSIDLFQKMDKSGVTQIDETLLSPIIRAISDNNSIKIPWYSTYIDWSSVESMSQGENLFVNDTILTGEELRLFEAESIFKREGSGIFFNP
tara:strand:- start:1231 stop:1587 length:357 start_codon:yes stop_codon:yes gene_type:complete